MSYQTALLIQALKSLGQKNITPGIIETLSRRLSQKEKAAALKEAANSTNWVYRVIKQICREEDAV